MLLYPDKPETKGAENALRRARQLTDLRWTPIRPIPSGAIFRSPDGGKHNLDTWLTAWRPQKGAIYSSVRKEEKFIGFNVSLETYVTALANPNSVLYTRPQHGMGRSMYAYYGTVCSSFVSYVCGLPLRLPCISWPTYPGVTEIDTAELENLRLCDVVLNPTQHIAIITGIRRDVSGCVREITVSESKTPMCVETAFTAEEFRGSWLERGFRIFRCDWLDRVTYTPDPFSPVEGDPVCAAPEINRSLLPDFGDKANYRLGEAVELTVLEPGWTQVQIAGAEEHTLAVADGHAAFTPQTPGFYTACCADGARRSRAVQFCVTNGRAQTEVSGGAVTMTFAPSSPEDTLVGWIVQNESHFLRGRGEFTPEQAHAGRAELCTLAPGRYYVFGLARNRFGLYKSEDASFEIE